MKWVPVRCVINMTKRSIDEQDWRTGVPPSLDALLGRALSGDSRRPDPETCDVSAGSTPNLRQTGTNLYTCQLVEKVAGKVLKLQTQRANSRTPRQMPEIQKWQRYI